MHDESRDVLPQPFRLDRSQRAGAVVLAPHGDLDIATADELAGAAEALPPDARLLAVDLRGVTFLDSSGLRGLLACRRSAERAGLDLVIAHDPSTHGPIFALTHLDKDLPLMDGEAFEARLAATG